MTEDSGRFSFLADDSGRELFPRPFGRYRLLSLLGQGGMGAVYLAEDQKLQRRVALKIPRFTKEASPKTRVRFFREARAAASFDHPNLCPVYDVGEVDGMPYMTMPYLKGRPLAEYIRVGKPFSQRKAASVVRTLALALASAHARGVLHRDLKPSNVMVNRRRELTIFDFGLARVEDPSHATLTRQNELLGTPAYMAPEQAAGQNDRVGPATDVYSLGVILFELLTSRRPFEGPPLLVLGLMQVAPVPRPSEYRPDLDPAMEAICLKALVREVSDRYGTMTEFALALETFIASAAATPEHAESPSSGEETPLPEGFFVNPSTPSPTETERLPTRRVAWVWGSIVVAAAMLIFLVSWLARDRGSVAAPPVGVASNGVDGTTVVEGPEKDSGGTHPGPAVGDVEKPKSDLASPSTKGTEPTTSPPSTSAEPEAKIIAPPSERPAADPKTPAKLWTNPVGMGFALIEPGTYEMGSPDSDPNAAANEKPTRLMRIDHPFYLGVCEVTQELFERLMGANPSKNRGSVEHPVECVTWFQAVAFCNRLSEREGRAPYYEVDGKNVKPLGGDGYRLPTEAEWEYACRAGGAAHYPFGDLPNRLGDFAWYADNSGKATWDATIYLHRESGDTNRFLEEVLRQGCSTHPVGRKQANAWGLFDMLGNVIEWCEDVDPSSRPRDSSLPDRVGRGGSWNNPAACSRSAVRWPNSPDLVSACYGIRVARNLKAAPDAGVASKSSPDLDATAKGTDSKSADKKTSNAGTSAGNRKKRLGGTSVSAVRPNSVGMTLLPVAPGQFLMGANPADMFAAASERPQHFVRISKPFFLGKTEVTQEQYTAVTRKNPSRYRRSKDNPVESVSWIQAVEFCNRLSEKEGLTPYYKIVDQEVKALGGNGYRLPTEAEWEYACRAGSPFLFSFGDDPQALANSAWFADNSGFEFWDAFEVNRQLGGDDTAYENLVAKMGCITHPVGRKAANGWGFHDMHGNVHEWCFDRYETPYGSQDLQIDPQGPNLGEKRVMRGGSHIQTWPNLRSSYRYPSVGLRDSYETVGFRVARNAH